MIKKTLYFGNPARLSVAHSQLRIVQPPRPPDQSETERTIPLEDIGLVVIDSQQVVITAAVLQGLMESGAAVVVCDSRHLPSGLMLNMEGHSEQAERFRAHLAASVPLKKQLWQQTVAAKIRNQCVVLEEYTGERAGNMRAWAEQVRSGDSDNLEARAAVYYWRRMFERTHATKRDRNGPEPNSLLNYGYAIVRAIVARALVSAGLHPTLGIFHRNKYNAYCLADDIMEPYRPYVDRLVTLLLAENKDATIKDMAVKRQLLSIPTLDVRIAGTRHPLMVAATVTAASVYKCFAGEARKIKYPDMQP